MLEIRGIWLCHMSRWDRYVLRPRVRAETSGSETVPHIGPYTPLKGTQHFGIKGKLAPCYIGPFRILAKCEEVDYQLELPPNLSRVNDVFHVSQLRRCFKDPIREVDNETLDLQDDLSY